MITREVDFSFNSNRTPPTGNYFPLAWKPHAYKNCFWQEIKAGKEFNIMKNVNFCF